MKLVLKALIGVAMVLGASTLASAATTFIFEGHEIDAEEMEFSNGIYFWEFDGNNLGGGQNPEFGQLIGVQGYIVAGDTDSNFNFDITPDDFLNADTGTWSSTYGVSGFVIKASNAFMFIDYNHGPVFGDNWCTTGQCTIGGVDLSQFNDGGDPLVYDFQLGNSADLSHLTLYALTVIPEPATWLMMVMGFGLVGIASRRRKRIVHS